jgi:FkbM family methyltransferase
MNDVSIVNPFFSEIDKYFPTDSIRIVYDIGAGNCEETLALRVHFPNAQIYAFECNPACIANCAANIVNVDRVHLINACIYDRDGFIKFHPINKIRTITTHADGNPRASSVYIANGTYELETYAQDEISILCSRLETLMETYTIPMPQVLWMDLQGSELAALRGLGVYLNGVKFIHTEATLKEIYTGQDMFPEINKFLEESGFKLLTKYNDKMIWHDFDYIRKELV